MWSSLLPILADIRQEHPRILVELIVNAPFLNLSRRDADLALRPGMTATVSVVTREANDVVLVPSAAFRFRPPATERNSGGFGLQDLFGGRRMGRIFERREPTVSTDGSRTLYVLRDGQPTATRVRTGSTDGENTEIVSGLEEGDFVVTGIGQPGGRDRR